MERHNPQVYYSRFTRVCQISLKDGEKIPLDEKTNNNPFKNFYVNLALNLLRKLSPLI